MVKMSISEQHLCLNFHTIEQGSWEQDVGGGPLNPILCEQLAMRDQ